MAALHFSPPLFQPVEQMTRPYIIICLLLAAERKRVCGGNSLPPTSTMVGSMDLVLVSLKDCLRCGCGHDDNKTRGQVFQAERSRHLLQRLRFPSLFFFPVAVGRGVSRNELASCRRRGGKWPVERTNHEAGWLHPGRSLPYKTTNREASPSHSLGPPSSSLSVSTPPLNPERGSRPPPLHKSTYRPAPPPMASRTTLTIIFAFSAAFWGLQILVEAGETEASRPQSRLARLAAAALAPAVFAAFAFALLLVSAHVRALDRASAAGRGGMVRSSISGWLADATLLTAMAALLAGAVLRLDAAGVLAVGGSDDVGWWLNTE